MKDDESKSLVALSNADYRRDLAELVAEIKRSDVAALDRRKNGFGALLHKRLKDSGIDIRTKPV